MPQPRAGKASYSGTPLSFTTEYGFSPMVAVALNFRFDSISAESCSASGACTNTKSVGPFDPNVDVKFKSRVVGGNSLYGGNVQYAVEKGKADSQGDRNNATGGSAITPYIGYEFLLGPAVAGGKLSYELYKGDAQREYAGTNFTVSGGQTLQLTGFYELVSDWITYGGSLAFQNVSEMKNTSNGVTNSYNDANTAILVQYYMVMRADGVSYLPSLNYSLRSYSASTYAYSSASEIFAGCGFRF